MRRAVLAYAICTLCACTSSTPDARDAGDGDAGSDGGDRDAMSAGPDAGECSPTDIAGWSCVQGDRETHVCTDSMVPPTCVGGRWQCGRGGEPDWYVDCWCHVGPWPWPEHIGLCACTETEGWTCDFHCGPALLCAAYEEYCERTPSDVGGEPDAFACRAFTGTCSSGAPACDCVAAGSLMCEPAENGGVIATYPGG